MNHALSRRRLLLGASSILPAGLLAACTISRSGGIVTGSLNLTQALAYMKTGDELATAVLAIPAVVSLVASAGLTAGVAAGLLALSNAYAAVLAATATSGGTVTLTIDTTSFRELGQSVLTAIGQLQGYATQVEKAVTGSVATDVQDGLSAIATVVPFLQLALGLTSDVLGDAVSAPMTPDQAAAVAADLHARYGLPAVRG